MHGESRWTLAPAPGVVDTATERNRWNWNTGGALPVGRVGPTAPTVALPRRDEPGKYVAPGATLRSAARPVTCWGDAGKWRQRGAVVWKPDHGLVDRLDPVGRGDDGMMVTARDAANKPGEQRLERHLHAAALPRPPHVARTERHDYTATPGFSWQADRRQRYQLWVTRRDVVAKISTYTAPRLGAALARHMHVNRRPWPGPALWGPDVDAPGGGTGVRAGVYGSGPESWTAGQCWFPVSRVVRGMTALTKTGPDEEPAISRRRFPAPLFRAASALDAFGGRRSNGGRIGSGRRSRLRRRTD